jgi:hypothetical protein
MEKPEDVHASCASPCSTDIFGILPTFMSVNEEVLRSAHDALECSLEHVKGELIQHDARFGRSTLKNKTWALRIEADIRMINAAFVSIRNSLGWPVP